MSGRSARRSVPRKRLPGGAGSPRAGARRSLLESTLESSADGILVVRESGRSAPLSTRAARQWGFPGRVVRRLALESGMRRAMERQEFELHYQPQAEVRTNRVTGVEALLRWRHPDWDLVSAAGFIALAEDTRLIMPLGDWVIRTACAQGRAWQDAASPAPRMAVNLSTRQFQQPDLAAAVGRILVEADLPPCRLEIEITEGIAMEDPVGAARVLNSLRDMGARISVDDFGTGYSSFSYLRNLPVDVLKIDISFIRDLTTDPRAAAIVVAIIAMAHCLGLEVIAEGVETEAQLAFLRAHDCDKFQGFLLAKPAPPHDVESMLPQQAAASPAAMARDVAMYMLLGGFSGMPIIEADGTIVGIVTELNLIRALRAGKKLESTPVTEIMTKSVITVDARATLDKVMELLDTERILRVPVMKRGRMVGVVSRPDVLRALVEPEFIRFG